MTQKNTNNERAYGALWFPKSNGAPETLNIRVLHASVFEFLQTATHFVSFDKKDNAGKGWIRIECNKKGTFGKTRDDIFCPLDAGERYGAPKPKQWFWVEDLTDGGLKYVEMPYSVRQQLEVLQGTAFRNAPLHDFSLQVIKSGKGLNTTYQIMPESLKAEPFDLKAYLGGLGLDVLPPLVGTKDFPPIWSLDEEGLENAAKGIMPWQGGGKAGAGTPEQDVEAYNPYGNPAPLTPSAPAAPAQAVAQAPVDAPKLDVVEDDLPESLQSIEEVEEEALDATGKKVFF